MWDIFRSRKQREEENIVAEREIIELKNEIKSIVDRTNELSVAYRKSGFELEVEKNSICPKCKGKNINDRIQRQQGFLNGDISGSSWSALTFGSGQMSGRIRGEMDTNEINKCNDCNHEWKKYKTTYKWGSDILKDKITKVYWHLQSLDQAKNCTFDPKDLSEKYNSLSEKKSALLLDAQNSYLKSGITEFWKGITLVAMKELAKQHLSGYQYDDFLKCWNEPELISLGFKQKQQIKTNQ